MARDIGAIAKLIRELRNHSISAGIADAGPSARMAKTAWKRSEDAYDAVLDAICETHEWAVFAKTLRKCSRCGAIRPPESANG